MSTIIKAHIRMVICKQATSKALKRKKDCKPAEQVYLSESDFQFTDLVCSSGLTKVIWWVRRPADLLSRTDPSVRLTQVTSRWFASSNGQQWRLHLIANPEERCIGLQLEASSLKDLLPQKANFLFRVHFFNKKLNKFGRNINKTYEDTFTRQILIIGSPRLISLARYSKHLQKGMFLEVHLRPSTSPNMCRSVTGFVGLINEGTTCYMNSLLQTLFMLTSFRRELYAINLSQSQQGRIPRALRKLFASLQLAPLPASTQELLCSFGWGREQWHVQHDAQEFNYTLSGTLENNFKHTSAQDVYAYLFKGQMAQIIECANVTCRSETYEEFIDLQLDVKDCRTIYDSFRKYTEEVSLTGDLQYESDQFGKQDARKSVKIVKLPRVLQIHLKRFEYNSLRGMMTKLNQELEFYQDLNLDEFVAPQQRGDNQYRLFSIIVHSGTLSAGHYYAFIDPRLDSQWLKFNDESVQKAGVAQAIQGNFGGERRDLMLAENGQIRMGTKKSDTSAYMLFYIKATCVEEVLPPLTDLDVPLSLQATISLAKEHKREQRRTPSKPQLCDIALCSLGSLANHAGPGITADRDFYCFLSVQREMNVSKLTEMLGDVLVYSFKPGLIDWKLSRVAPGTQMMELQSSFDYVNRALFVASASEVLVKQEGKWKVGPKGESRAGCDGATLLFVKVHDEERLRLAGFELFHDSMDFNEFRLLLFDKYLSGMSYGWLCLERASSDFLCIEDLTRNSQKQLRFMNGDCVIIGTALHPDIPQRLHALMSQVDLKAVYIDSQESFGQRSFSKSLFSSSPTVAFKARLNDSQAALMQIICRSIGKPEVHWEQITLLNKNYRALPAPSNGSQFNLLKLLDNNSIYFDVSAHRFTELSNKLLLKIVEFNINFHPLQFYERIVDPYIKFAQLRELVRTFSKNECLFLYNYRQRSVLRFLTARDRIDHLATNKDLVVGASVMAMANNIFQVIQVFDIEEGAERPLFIEVCKDDTCTDVKDEIAEKASGNSDFDIKVVALDSEEAPTKFVVVDSLPESNDPLVGKCPSKTLMVELKKQRMKIQ